MVKVKWLSLAAVAILVISGLGYMTISAVGEPVPVDHDGPSLLAGLYCPNDTMAIGGHADYRVGGRDAPSTPEVALARFLAGNYPKATPDLFVKVGQDLRVAVFQATDQAKAVAEAIGGKWYLSEWTMCQSTAQKWGA